MTMSMNKLPCFWEEIIYDFPLCRSFRKNFKDIRAEVLDYMKQKNAVRDYPKYIVSFNNKDYQLYDSGWKTAGFSKFEGENINLLFSKKECKEFNTTVRRAKKACPTLNEIITPLEKENNLVNAFASSLVPGTIIRPHAGSTSNFMRIHLCLKQDSKCFITVGSETKSWKRGKIIAFNDGLPYLHSVRHEGKRERIILSVDIRIDPVLLPYVKEFY